MKRTLLLIDNDLESRKALCALLKNSYALLEAQNEAEARALIVKSSADISAILVDIEAPGADGCRTLRRMLEDKSIAHIPIVAMMDSDDEGTESRALALGATDYIAKPYSPYTVKRRLANIISAREFQVQMQLATQLVDDSSSAVYVCDAATYELLYVNKACANMCSKTVEEARGCTCYRYLKNADKPCEGCYMFTARDDRYTVREYSSPSTGRHYMARDKFIDWGGRRALVEYLTDETERINSRLSLEASQRGMEMASVNGGVSFWHFDLDKRLLTWGDYRRSDYLGYPDVMPDLPDSMLQTGDVHSEDAAEFIRMYDELFADAESCQCTVRLLNRKTGKYSWHHLVYTRLHDAFYTSRQAIGFASSVDLQHEMSARYEHELKLRHELTKDCESYFQINLTTRCIEEYRSTFHDVDAGKNSIPSDEVFRSELLRHVMPEDRNAVKDTFFIDGLLKLHQRGGDTASLDYRRLLSDGSSVWLRGTATIMKKPSTNELIAFVYNRSIDREKKDQLALDCILGEEIESACLVNVKSGMAHLLKIADGMLAGVHRDEDFLYNELIQANIQGGVLPEDRPLLEPMLSVKSIQQALANQPSLILTYRASAPGGRVLRKRNMLFYLDERREDIVISRRDITRLYEAEAKNESMRKSEELLRLVVEHSARVIYRYDVATREAVSVQPRASAAMGLPDFVRDMPQSLIDDGVICAEDAPYVLSLFSNARKNGGSDSMRFRVHSSDGKMLWLDVKYTFVTNGTNPTAAVISCLDVTKQHERELAYARYRQSTDNVQEGSMLYFETDITADLVEKQGGELLEATTAMHASSYTEIADAILAGHFTDDNREAARRFLSRDHLLTLYADGTRDVSQAWQVRFNNGELHWANVTMQMVADPFTGHIKIFTIVLDVTQERQSALDFQARAERDGMTGLYNKTTAEALIRKRLAELPSKCALLVLDLDYLKAINDSLGHEYGDKAIKGMAEALCVHFRKTDIIGRIGGDEFIALLGGCASETELRTLLSALMRKLAGIRVSEESNIPLRASIGVAISSGESYEELFRRADRALYQVKRNGKDDFAFYTPEMELDAFKYTSHRAFSVWQTRGLDNEEMARLLKAVSTVFPLVISVNLTQNSYRMLQCESFPTKASMNAGVFDALISDGAASFHPEDRESFLAAFSRQSLLAAFERGEHSVSHIGRQLGDDGVYRLIRTDAIFSPSTNSADVLEITLAREAGAR